MRSLVFIIVLLVIIAILVARKFRVKPPTKHYTDQEVRDYFMNMPGMPSLPPTQPPQDDKSVFSDMDQKGLL